MKLRTRKFTHSSVIPRWEAYAIIDYRTLTQTTWDKLRTCSVKGGDAGNESYHFCKTATHPTVPGSEPPAFSTTYPPRDRELNYVTHESTTHLKHASSTVFWYICAGTDVPILRLHWNNLRARDSQNSIHVARARKRSTTTDQLFGRSSPTRHHLSHN